MSNSKQYSYFVQSKWTKLSDEPIKKTPKARQDNQNPALQEQQQQRLQEETSPYDWALENDISQLSQQNQGFGLEGYTRRTSKRDEFNQKLGDRDFHTQVGQNPFLAGESYLNHLNIEQQFLRPQNTNSIMPNTNG
jgi:hypothetical protein